MSLGLCFLHNHSWGNKSHLFSIYQVLLFMYIWREAKESDVCVYI